VGIECSLALDDAGRPHIVSFDGITWEIKYAVGWQAGARLWVPQVLQSP
jgi:hypothetical protein